MLSVSEKTVESVQRANSTIYDRGLEAGRQEAQLFLLISSVGRRGPERREAGTAPGTRRPPHVFDGGLLQRRHGPAGA